MMMMMKGNEFESSKFRFPLLCAVLFFWCTFTGGRAGVANDGVPVKGV